MKPKRFQCKHILDEFVLEIAHYLHNNRNRGEPLICLFDVLIGMFAGKVPRPDVERVVFAKLTDMIYRKDLLECGTSVIHAWPTDKGLLVLSEHLKSTKDNQ